ncbi:MAG: AI-2E family transporter [Bacteroidaceae bacterium]|nr:AI-2E family transporter [Bacteroidaceae bacterium]
MLQKEITFDRFVRGALFLIVVGAACYLINYLSAVLLPFFVAWLLAYMLYPLVVFFERKCRLRSRLLSIVVTLVLVVGVLTGIGYLFVPAFVGEFAHVKEVAIGYIEHGATNSTIPPAVQEFFTEHANELQLDRLLRQQDVQSALKTLVPKVWSVLWSTVGIVVGVLSSLIGLLYLFFLLMDYERFAHGWVAFVPRRRRPFVRQLVGDVMQGMSRYFRGQALVALSNCVMFSVGFLLIGFPLPVALGLFIGVISFVPYLQLVGFLPAVVLALLRAAETGDNFWVLIGGVVLVYVVVQILQDTIFTPRIMGQIMGLNAAIVLLALSVWGYLLGIIGLIIALPVTTLIISYYKRYVVGTADTLPETA